MKTRLGKGISNVIGISVIFIALLILILTMVKAGDFISGDIPKRKNVSLKYSMLVDELASEVKLLQDYLNKMDERDARLIWHPLNFANYIFIPDSVAPNSAYVGTSFLRETTRQRDYPGFYNLGPEHEKIKASMMKGELDSLCHAIWQNNINYIIANKFLFTDGFKEKFQSYFSYEKDFDILDPQLSAKFAKTIFGETLASFGKGLELYHIHPNLRSSKLEIYQGNKWQDELKQRDWCVEAGIGKIMSNYSYNPNLNEYTVKANIQQNSNISLLLADELGYRYHLEIDSPMANLVENVNYKQHGAKFIVSVTFKEPFTGNFIGHLVTKSVLEKYMKLILILQIVLLFSILIYIILKKRSKNMEI